MLYLRTILLLLLLPLLLVSCGPSEREVELQRELDELKAAQATKAEEEKSAAAEGAKEQSAKLKKEILALAKQMALKEYECAGVFYSNGSLLKRNGYDEDLRQPSKDVVHYVDLFKTVVASYPKVESPPSLIKFNELAQTWADAQKEYLKGMAIGSASIKANAPSSGREAIKEAEEDRKTGAKWLLDSIEKLFE